MTKTFHAFLVFIILQESRICPHLTYCITNSSKFMNYALFCVKNNVKRKASTIKMFLKQQCTKVQSV